MQSRGGGYGMHFYDTKYKGVSKNLSLVLLKIDPPGGQFLVKFVWRRLWMFLLGWVHVEDALSSKH